MRRGLALMPGAVYGNAAGALPARPPLAYAGSCMLQLPLAESSTLQAALQLGPLALLGVLYARRVRTLAPRTAIPCRDGARPASTGASS